MQRNWRRAAARPTFVKFLRETVRSAAQSAQRAEPFLLSCDCAVAKQSKPQWGFEAHERARFAGWRPSFWPPSGRLGSSGTFLVLFWSQKSTHNSEKPLKRESGRRVAASGSYRAWWRNTGSRRLKTERITTKNVRCTKRIPSCHPLPDAE